MVMARLLILSDLHNEALNMDCVFDGRHIDLGADVVVLAGDIHEGVEAPIWARRAFPGKEIVLVAGNHEFYNHYWHQDLQKIRDVSVDLGIHFLENDSVELFGVRFLGCTLWTDYSLYGQEQREKSMSEAQRLMTDFQRIMVDPRTEEIEEGAGSQDGSLSPLFTLRRHEQSVAWLDQQLAASDPNKTVVVTHHPPLAASIPEPFLGDVLSPAYASNLVKLVGRSRLWIHGHVHSSKDYMHEATRVICNPRGYARVERAPLNPDFNPTLLVDI